VAKFPHKIHKLEHWKVISLLLMIYDFLAFILSFFLALWLRYDCRFSAIPGEYLRILVRTLPLYSIVSITVYYFFRLYRSMWQFASFTELTRVLMASVTTSLINLVGITLLCGPMPVVYYLLGPLLQFVLTLGIRFSYRYLLMIRSLRKKSERIHTASRVMLIGAGEAGQTILRELKNSAATEDAVMCIIDDTPNKWNRDLEGVPIVGGREDILKNVEKYRIEKILFAIPSAPASDRQEILNICSETGCELKSLPGIYQLINGQVSLQTMKTVDVEDLLGRAPVQVNMQELYDFISGKVVLVTGGGGSIGSELCRQIARRHPKKLVIFDIYENNAHAIGLELRDKFPRLDLEVLIGSVRDSRRIEDVFRRFRPDVVYHAAAHKHVPLMEDSPCEAIKNNALGTYKTAYAAMLYGCRRFVLVSTDKAVNPTNIMGASKRLCEMIIQSFDRKIKDGRAGDLQPLHYHGEDLQPLPEHPVTEFVAVRFGNVLGSNGSVIPRFKEQIARGGPVTVTHPEIIRYFMTIPEAASLVLQAGTYAQGGEIFVLDMGAPVKIDTLARNLIKLSGLRPDVDIQISYTGLRPGEKLYEEKLMDEEGMKTTPNKLIHIGCPIPFDADEFLRQLRTLMDAVMAEQLEDIRDLVADIVPTYRPEAVGRADSTFRRQQQEAEAKAAGPASV